MHSYAFERVTLLRFGAAQGEHVDRISCGDQGFRLSPDAHIDVILILQQHTDGFHARERLSFQQSAVCQFASSARTGSDGATKWSNWPISSRLTPFHGMSTKSDAGREDIAEARTSRPGRRSPKIRSGTTSSP